MKKLATLAAVLLCATTLFAQAQASYLYTLSTFSGPLRYDWVRLSIDRSRSETYVIYQDLVRIFSASGMEVFSFGDDLELGHIVDLSVDDRGDIILLSHDGTKPVVTRCNYRGQPIAPIEIRNLPDGVPFSPNRVIFQGGQLYFASLGTSSVVITDAGGEFRRHVEFLPKIDEDQKQKTGAEMIGFTVDPDGAMYFTMPTMFKVFKMTNDGTLTSFGRPGSAAGRFGVIAGIAIDGSGNLLVADKLKCVVMVFDKDFNFLTEFGYRGAARGNLVVPDDVAVDAAGKVYVSQGRRRGVSVFALTRD